MASFPSQKSSLIMLGVGVIGSVCTCFWALYDSVFWTTKSPLCLIKYSSTKVFSDLTVVNGDLRPQQSLLEVFMNQLVDWVFVIRYSMPPYGLELYLSGSFRSVMVIINPRTSIARHKQPFNLRVLSIASVSVGNNSLLPDSRITMSLISRSRVQNIPYLVNPYENDERLGSY